jgi:hypothetical protein
LHPGTIHDGQASAGITDVSAGATVLRIGRHVDAGSAAARRAGGPAVAGVAIGAGRADGRCARTRCSAPRGAGRPGWTVCVGLASRVYASRRLTLPGSHAGGTNGTADPAGAAVLRVVGQIEATRATAIAEGPGRGGTEGALIFRNTAGQSLTGSLEAELAGGTAPVAGTAVRGVTPRVGASPRATEPGDGLTECPPIEETWRSVLGAAARYWQTRRVVRVQAGAGTTAPEATGRQGALDGGEIWQNRGRLLEGCKPDRALEVDATAADTSRVGWTGHPAEVAILGVILQVDALVPTAGQRSSDQANHLDCIVHARSVSPVPTPEERLRETQALRFAGRLVLGNSGDTAAHREGRAAGWVPQADYE